MSYVSRVGGIGAVNGIFNMPQFPGQESLPDADPQIASYLASQAPPDGGVSTAARLAALEATMAKVTAVPVVAAGIAAQAVVTGS